MVSATLEDFVVFSNYRNLTPEEEEQLTMLLKQAASQISSYLGTTDWSIEAQPEYGIIGDDGSVAQARQLHMVKRYFDNQQGLTAESFDGISNAYDDRAHEGLRLTPYDKEELSRGRAKKAKIRTIGIHRNFGSIW